MPSVDVTITLEGSDDPKYPNVAGVTVPPAVVAALDAMAYTHRKEHVKAIEEAKKPETRRRRVEQAVAAMTERAAKKTAKGAVTGKATRSAAKKAKTATKVRPRAKSRD